MENSVGYNLFRSSADLTMVCAVPIDCPVPSFIDKSVWAYDSQIEIHGAHPIGFLSALAKRCSDLNGFYFFRSPYRNHSRNREVRPAVMRSAVAAQWIPKVGHPKPPERTPEAVFAGHR
jgi:hypothetical protein